MATWNTRVSPTAGPLPADAAWAGTTRGSIDKAASAVVVAACPRRVDTSDRDRDRDRDTDMGMGMGMDSDRARGHGHDAWMTFNRIQVCGGHGRDSGHPTPHDVAWAAPAMPVWRDL